MLGAISGDIIGSRFEHAQIKSKVFDLFHRSSIFTDDTVLTVAVADALLHGGLYQEAFRDYFHHYPAAGYGGRFRRWARSPRPRPYDSFGNGSAMRVSPVPWFFNDLDTVLDEALRCAEVTHNHPEGIKGAQAVAAAVFLARTERDKGAIRDYIIERFGYDLDHTLEEIRPDYGFDVSCQGSVPQAIIAFLEATDFEDAIRNAVSLGGDSDTLACIAGSIAEAYYGGIPADYLPQIRTRLDDRLNGVVDQFMARVSS